MAIKPFRKRQNTGRRWRIGKVQITNTLRVPIVVFTLILIYGVISLVVNKYNPVRTTSAAEVSMDDSFTANGYFFREEQVIDIAEGDTVEYNYSDGEKVAVNSSIVTEYSDENALSVSRALKNVKDNIEQLQLLRSTARTSTNTSQLNQKIVNEMTQISSAVDENSFSQIANLTAELRQLTLKSGSLQGSTEDIDNELSGLQAQESELSAQLDGKTSEVYAPYAGYFCESVDGFENVFTMDKIENLTLGELTSLAKQGEAAAKSKGKLVNSYVWYFAASVSDEQAARLTTGNTLKLRFSQVSQDIGATVYAIRDDADSDKTLVIFKSLDMNKTLVSLRNQAAAVIIASYQGLKVPKSAVRMEDDEMGVYVLSNSVASYKMIEPLFEGEDYYVVKQNVTGNSSLVVGDDIITEAKDLYDKKVVT